jgi:hypothetical protein
MSLDFDVPHDVNHAGALCHDLPPTIGNQPQVPTE